MSRELYVKLDESAVVAKCEAAHVGISAIERLPAGGVRLVCKSADGAAEMTRKFKRNLIKENVTRQRHRPVRPLW
jgi:hypothetical protein